MFIMYVQKQLEDNKTFYVPKNHSCILVINSFITYHENDLEILMITMACLVSK